MKRHGVIESKSVSGNTASALILGILFVLGGLVGCLLARNIQGEGGAALRQYLETYFSLAESETIHPDFWPVVWEQMRFPIMAVALGFTAAGLVGIPVLFFVRGFLFTFSAAGLLRTLGNAGFLPAVLLFGIPAMLWTPALFLIGVYALQSCYIMLLRGMGEKVQPPFLQGRYWVRCGLCTAALCLCILFEYFALPALMRVYTTGGA